MLTGALFAVTSTTAAAFGPKTSSAFRHGATRAFSRSSSLMANPKVFFDMEVGGEGVGRIEFELFADVVPKTAEVSEELYFSCKKCGDLGLDAFRFLCRERSLTTTVRP
jgi:hypothetical protein